MGKNTRTEKQTKRNEKADLRNPPPGYAYAPMLIEPYMVKEWALDPKYVTTMRIGKRKHLVYLILCEEKTAIEHLQALKNEMHREDRQDRCFIESSKSGKAIRCPDERSCYGCPFADAMRQVPCANLSTEEMAEDGVELEIRDSTSDEALTRLIEAEILKDLSAANRKLVEIYERLLEGKEPKEIGEELHLKKSTLYDGIKTIRKIAKKHLNQ